MPLSNNFFNLVLSFETLEHVKDEAAVIQEINRVSTDDAILVISVPIEFGIILMLKEFFRWAIYRSNYSITELFYASIHCNLSKVKRLEHKGYDYKNTLKMLAPSFELIKKKNTPFRWLPDILSYGTILVFLKKK